MSILGVGTSEVTERPVVKILSVNVLSQLVEQSCVGAGDSWWSNFGGVHFGLYLSGDEQLRKFSGIVLSRLVGGVGIVLGG